MACHRCKSLICNRIRSVSSIIEEFSCEGYIVFFSVFNVIIPHKKIQDNPHKKNTRQSWERERCHMIVWTLLYKKRTKNKNFFFYCNKHLVVHAPSKFGTEFSKTGSHLTDYSTMATSLLQLSFDGFLMWLGNRDSPVFEKNSALVGILAVILKL